MGMFDMGGVKGAKVVSSSYLRAGIHNVVFKGVDKADIPGSESAAVEFRFEAVDGSGIHNERLFEPRSAERQPNRFNSSRMDPSQAEQFMCKCKQIISALDPELGKRIDEEGEKFSAPNFDGFIKLLKKYLDPKIGTTTWIKLLPNGKYYSFPGFPAILSKDGNIIMTTKFIGEDLVLSSYEKQQIDKANTAKPTDMSSKTDELSDVADEFKPDTISSIDDDLPF